MLGAVGRVGGALPQGGCWCAAEAGDAMPGGGGGDEGRNCTASCLLLLRRTTNIAPKTAAAAKWEIMWENLSGHGASHRGPPAPMRMGMGHSPMNANPATTAPAITPAFTPPPPLGGDELTALGETGAVFGGEGGGGGVEVGGVGDGGGGDGGGGGEGRGEGFGEGDGVGAL